MTKYIIKYQNGDVVILSGEEKNTEEYNYTKESEKTTHKNTKYGASVLTDKYARYGIDVSVEKKNHKTPDQSLLDVFTSSISNLTKIIFGPFVSNKEEEEEE